MRKMFDEEMIKKIASEAGGNYQAGNGISIEEDTISVDETVALKEEIPTKTSDLVNDSGFGPALYKHRVWLSEGGVSGSSGNRAFGCRFDIVLPVNTAFTSYTDFIAAAASYYGNDMLTGASGDLRVTDNTTATVPDISSGYPSTLKWSNTLLISNVGVNNASPNVKVYLFVTPGAVYPVNAGTNWNLTGTSAGIPTANIASAPPTSGRITFVLDVNPTYVTPQFKDEVLGAL